MEVKYQKVAYRGYFTKVKYKKVTYGRYFTDKVQPSQGKHASGASGPERI